MNPQEIPYEPLQEQATYMSMYNCYYWDNVLYSPLPIHIIPKTPPGSPPITCPGTPSGFHSYSPYITPSVSHSGLPPCSPYPSSSATMPGGEVLPVMQSNKNLTRKVKIPKYRNRAVQLEECRPVYKYKPVILNEYTKSDYSKHVAVYTKALEEDNIELMNSKKSATARSAYTLLTGKQASMTTLDATVLTNQIKPNHLRDIWYLVVDTKVLLEDMFFIEKLVKSDKNCRLHLPYEILHDITAMTHKRQAAYIRIPAIRVAKFQKRLFQCGKGQSASESEDVVESPMVFDSTLNCCMQLMKRYFYVVLITDDQGRRDQAKGIDLPCYSLSEARELTTREKLSVTFNLNASLPYMR